VKVSSIYYMPVSLLTLCAVVPSSAQNQLRLTPIPDEPSRTMRALLRHKALLASSVSRQGLEEDLTAKTRNPILNAQFASPVEVSSDRNVGGSGGYYFAEKDGRDFEMSEWNLGVRVSPKIGFWFGSQAYSAKGRTRVPRRSSFNTTATRFGLRYQLTGTETKGFNLQYDAYHSGMGEAVYQNSEAIFPGPKTDVLTLTYTIPNQQEFSEVPELPGKRLRLNIANVQGIGRGSTSFGGGGGATFKIARRLYGDADLLGILENRRGGPGGTALKLHAHGGLTYQPAHWAKVQMGFDLFPNGVPFGGSALSGLSAFGVYRSNDGVTGFSNGFVGVLNLRLEVGYRF
jgi:hypothetical protein